MEVYWALQNVSKYSGLGVSTFWNRPQNQKIKNNFLWFLTFSFDFYQKLCRGDPHYFSPAVIFVPDGYPKKIKGKPFWGAKIIFAGKLDANISNWVKLFLVQFFACRLVSPSPIMLTSGWGNLEFKKWVKKSQIWKNRSIFSSPTCKKPMKEWFNRELH